MRFEIHRIALRGRFVDFGTFARRAPYPQLSVEIHATSHRIFASELHEGNSMTLWLTLASILEYGILILLFGLSIWSFSIMIDRKRAFAGKRT